MPYRITPLSSGQIYHVINRSIAGFSIFNNLKDHLRAIELIDYYRYQKPALSFSHYERLNKEDKKKYEDNLTKKPTLVSILSFCLMPNHCHFLLKQDLDKGISNFMRNFQNSYAKYLNTKYKRFGGVFQSMFKAVRIETDEQLLHVSRYIHLNPSTSYIIEIKNLKDYSWSSLSDYLGSKNYNFIDTTAILAFYKSEKDYEKFVLNQAKYQQELQLIKNLTLED